MAHHSLFQSRTLLHLTQDVLHAIFLLTTLYDSVVGQIFGIKKESNFATISIILFPCRFV
nr:MAG TPA: hypothetical protein [Caudoviricetes sp.]